MARQKLSLADSMCPVRSNSMMACDLLIAFSIAALEKAWNALILDTANSLSWRNFARNLVNHCLTGKSKIVKLNKIQVAVAYRQISANQVAIFRSNSFVGSNIAF